MQMILLKIKLVWIGKNYSGGLIFWVYGCLLCNKFVSMRDFFMWELFICSLFFGKKKKTEKIFSRKIFLYFFCPILNWSILLSWQIFFLSFKKYHSWSLIHFIKSKRTWQETLSFPSNLIIKFLSKKFFCSYALQANNLVSQGIFCLRYHNSSKIFSLDKLFSERPY